MKFLPKMNVWAHKDAFQDLQEHLDHNDVAQLRESCKDWRGVVDSTISKLAPVNLDCPLLRNRALPSLKSLHITQLQHLQPQQLLHCSALRQLTQLHIGGTACSRLKTHHLAWIGRLTKLQDLSISKCSKVKLSILSCCHSLTALKTLTLIGLSVNPTDSSFLNPFLAAGAALNLTSLVLGDQQGLSFLSDSALEGLGQLLGPLGRIRVLDLSGCIELTDTGLKHLSGLTSLEHLSLHNCMKIGTNATQTLAAFKSLKTLNLRGCSQLSDTQVLPVLKTLTCLESLNLQGCSGLVGTCLNPGVCKGLVKLSSLNLSYCQGLRPSVFEGLALLPRLQVLDTSGCNIISGFEVLATMGKLTQLTNLQGNYWRCKGPSAAAAAVSSSCCQQPAALLPPNLKHLSLSHLSCSEAFLETLIAHCPKSLTYLDLSQCLGFGPASSPDCFQGLSHLSLLQTLKLSSGLGGMPGCVLGFISALENLNDLQLEYVHNSAPAAAIDEVMAAAGSSSNSTEWLQALLSCSTASSSSPCRCMHADPAAVPAAPAAAATVEGLQQRRLAAGVAQLQPGTASSSSSSRLSLSSSSSSDSQASIPVRRILFSQPNCSCSCAVSADRRTSQIRPQNPRKHCWQGLSQLQTVTVTFSPSVTDQAVASLSGLSCLTSLNLTACQNLTGSGFQAWISQASSSRCCSSSTQCRSRSRSRLARSAAARSADSAAGTYPDLDLVDRDLRPRLIHLNLTGCGGLTDQGLAAVAAACPRLQELLLPGCRGVGDLGVEQLRKLDRLRVLSLASNRNITARSLAALSPQLRHLKKLSLSLCSSICDNALSHMAAAPALTSADLRGCWQITDQGVYSLLSSSRSLLQLNVESCHRLSSRCCRDNFMPGGVPLPDPNSGSSRPGLLVRVAHHSMARAVPANLQCDDRSLGETTTGPCGFEQGLEVASAAARGEIVAEGSSHEGGEGCAMRFEMFALQQALQQ